MNGDEDEPYLREQIAYFSRMLVESDLVEYKGGNLSVRIGESDMLLTRRSAPKGRQDRDDVVRTSIDHIDDNAALASSAYEIHRAIYQRTDALAIIHAHPSKTVSLSLFQDELVPLEENGLLYLRPGVKVVAPRELFGWNLAADEFADALASRSVVVQKWHGTFAKGRDLEEAFHRTRAVEFMSAHLIRVAELRQYFGEPAAVPSVASTVIGGVPGRGLKKMD